MFSRALSTHDAALRLLLTLTACLVGLSASSAPVMGQSIAKPDHLLAISKGVRVIQPMELMANDEISGFASVHIDQPPVYGQLSVVSGPDGTYFEYSSPWLDGGQRPFLGRDHFTYQLVSDGQPSATATVVVHVRPRWIPITGRWESDGANETTFGGLGGDEPTDGLLQGGFGFYNSETSLFRLCELTDSLSLEFCREFEVPASHAQEGLTPVVGDWDADGRDEVGVHDIRSGSLALFQVHEGTCEKPGPENCLELMAEHTVGPPGTQALVGNWGGTLPLGDHFGIWEADSGWVRLGPSVAQEDQAYYFELDLGTAGLDAAQAVTGQWSGIGPETAASYDGASGWVDITPDHSGNSFTRFKAEVAHGPLVGGVAFAATNLERRARFIGIFIEAESTTYLFATNRTWLGQVMVRVPTDPDGGCCR